MSVAAIEKHSFRTFQIDDPRWEEALDEHRAALAAFLDTAEALREDDWAQPWGPGKWTRAQVAEHLALGYEMLVREIATGQPPRTPLPAWKMTLLRWVFLPHILFHRSFPVRARAPRETRPPDASRPRAEALRRLRELGERFELELDRARRMGGGWVTNPYFGRIGPVKALRLAAIHIEHHTRQIARKTK